MSSQYIQNVFSSSTISGIGVMVTVGLLTVITWIINIFLSQRNMSIRYGKHVPGKV